MASSLF